MSNYRPDLDGPDDGPPMNWDDITPPDEPLEGWSPDYDQLLADVPFNPAVDHEHDQQLSLFESLEEPASIHVAVPQADIQEVDIADLTDPTLYGFIREDAGPTGWESYELEPVTPGSVTGQAASITALDSDDLIARAEAVDLYDARFLGITDVDETGQPVGYTLQCLEVYQDLQGTFSGQILDVGHYPNQEQAEADYFQLQGAVSDGGLPVYTIAPVAEGIAESHNLEPAWRNVTPGDWQEYERHLGLDGQTADIPPDTADLEPLVFSAVKTAQELEQQQAVEALRAAGLEPPPDFDLVRDTYLDQDTGERIMAGVFQQDLADSTRNCQATFVSLSPGEAGFQAQAAAFGGVGSFEDARTNWSQVQTALYDNGPESALEAMEGIQTQLDREGAEPVLDQETPDEWRAQQPSLDL